MRDGFILLVSLIFVSFITDGVLAQEFSDGQVWSYKTRAGETGSTVHIKRIDEGPEGVQIVSATLKGLSLKSPKARVGVTDVIQHIPISADVLRGSVVDYLRDGGDLTTGQEGYVYWKSEFDAGRAGWFTVPLSEVVDIVEQSINP